MKFVSEIFNNRPIQWGLRGDPFLWDEMHQYFSEKELPYTQEQFDAEFRCQFKLMTGDELGSAKRTFVRRYAMTGMSKGTVSHTFWLEKGLPLLLSRIKEEEAV